MDLAVVRAGTGAAGSFAIVGKWVSGVALFAALWLLTPEPRAADIFISSNIQSAINAAAPGDVIHLAAGRYGEVLTINKSLSLVGSGTNCVIYSYQTDSVPLISITGPATVAFAGFELNGGAYQSYGNWYNGFSSMGIVATNASLIMNSVAVNQVRNYCLTVQGGSLFATNLGLWTVDILMGCDVGIELDNCVAVIDGLKQDTGHLDHTININMASIAFSDVTVVNSSIRASRLTWGNCLRTYCNSKVVVTNSYLYRGTSTNEQDVPFPQSQVHDGIGVYGYSNKVTLAGNTFSNLPWGIFCYASSGGVQLLIQSNRFVNSIYGGLFIDWMAYKAVDMGGGAPGSRGGNVFSEAPALLAAYRADVYYTNSSAMHPLANLFALHNIWSNPTNKEASIWDKLDNPDYGRVIADDLTLKTLGRDASGRPVLSWNERGAGESYTLETRGTLGTGTWKNAPGSWPVSNPGFRSLLWTNPTPVSTNVLYRLRSVVP